MVILRAPSTLPTTEPSPSIAPPQLSWLQGPWNVTHSTLPMWKKSRNVRITYTPIPNTSPTQIEDVVTYQSLSSTSLKTVHGVDKAFKVPETAPAHTEGDEVASMAYNWRGKGWLMIASSKWEILGYGDDKATGNSWVVTYFAKTLFTPAGVDFYSRKGSLTPELVQSIESALARLGGEVARLAGDVFAVKMDGDRTE
ncbi:hypothetical protein EJ02DRAFT_338305 [Clathrospora elynae]|uniref:Uncharacterized protein n=1 Tax=Clathrospora elynae TaxID=706981 RepID=A0A6A5SY73_9PLEO|nr:hypothetical protein EJ02DRAFT_338305 [Clathrospora elynae]